MIDLTIIFFQNNSINTVQIETENTTRACSFKEYNNYLCSNKRQKLIRSEIRSSFYYCTNFQFFKRANIAKFGNKGVLFKGLTMIIIWLDFYFFLTFGHLWSGRGTGTDQMTLNWNWCYKITYI